MCSRGVPHALSFGASQLTQHDCTSPQTRFIMFLGTLFVELALGPTNSLSLYMWWHYCAIRATFCFASHRSLWEQNCSKSSETSTFSCGKNVAIWADCSQLEKCARELRGGTRANPRPAPTTHTQILKLPPYTHASKLTKSASAT